MAEQIRTGIGNASETARQTRERLRERIARYQGAERAIHLLISAALGINTALMLFTLVHVIGWLLIAGLPIIDSLPLVLYVVPLLIILPSLVYSYYTSRSANVNLIVTIIELVIFIFLSNLVHGFFFLVVLNIVSLFFMLIYGQFGFQGDIRELGKKGIAWFIFMNLLGLAMPTATYVMGRNPIATLEAGELSPLHFSVSVHDSTSEMQNQLDQLKANGFGLDLKISDEESDWLNKTSTWLHMLNSTKLNYSITITSNRESIFHLVNSIPGSAELIDLVFQSHYSILNKSLHAFDFTSALERPNRITLDMRFSRSEWALLFSRIRGVDFSGFSVIIRSVLDSSNRSLILDWTNKLTGLANSFGISLGLLVEPFVLDDSMDGDDNAMRACGVISDTLSIWDSIEVSCNRTLFSEAMRGDVGEYFLYAYSQSVHSISYFDSIRISNVGNSPYSEIDTIADDISLASRGRVKQLTIESLSSLSSSFGQEAIQLLNDVLSIKQEVAITYTFRVYAFRVVFVAIDAYDPLFL